MVWNKLLGLRKTDYVRRDNGNRFVGTIFYVSYPSSDTTGLKTEGVQVENTVFLPLDLAPGCEVSFYRNRYGNVEAVEVRPAAESDKDSKPGLNSSVK